MEYVALGISLGLAAGLTPGPLLTYTIVATLRSGWKAGVSVGIAPLLTDLPIIALSLLVLHLLPPEALRLLGLIGGLVVIYLGIETARSAQHMEHLAIPEHVNLRQEMGKGILVNFLNPNPYVFWGTVGGPLLLQAYTRHPALAGAFLAIFYTLLVGSHVGLAFIVHHQRDGLRGPWYRRTLWVLALALVVIGVRLIMSN